MAKDFIVDLDGDGLLDIVRVYNRKKGGKKTKVANVKFGTSKMKRKKKKSAKKTTSKKKSKRKSNENKKKNIKTITFKDAAGEEVKIIIRPHPHVKGARIMEIHHLGKKETKVLLSKDNITKEIQKIKKEKSVIHPAKLFVVLSRFKHGLWYIVHNGKIVVRGDTYQIKGKLRDLGFKWDPTYRVWYTNATKDLETKIKRLGAKKVKVK